MDKKTEYRDWKNNPVTDDELYDFWKKVQQLANDTFGVDDEGDSTVEITLVDRTRHHRMHYYPVPYYDQGEILLMADLQKSLDIATTNHAVAVDDLHRLLRVLKYYVNRVKK